MIWLICQVVQKNYNCYSFLYILFCIHLTESLSNVRSSTLDGTFSVFSGKCSILMRFSLCDLSLGAPFPGLHDKILAFCQAQGPLQANSWIS